MESFTIDASVLFYYASVACKALPFRIQKNGFSPKKRFFGYDKERLMYCADSVD